MFSHTRLKVYDKALASSTALLRSAAQWNKRHSVVDQLCRASESIVINLAQGARLWNEGSKQHCLDYSIGSALECAACLDIAVIKQFLSSDLALTQKRALREVVRMLVGLRKSWQRTEFHEELQEYICGPDSKGNPWLFGQERLEVYQVSLRFMDWFHRLPGGAELPSRLFRQVDQAATSVILNVAEGNGRFASADRRTFLDTAEGMCVKAVAYLDLCAASLELAPEQKAHGSGLLARVDSMLKALSGSAFRRQEA